MNIDKYQIAKNPNRATNNYEGFCRIKLYNCFVKKITEKWLKRPGQSNQSRHKLYDFRAYFQNLIFIVKQSQVLNMIESLENRDH